MKKQKYTVTRVAHAGGNAYYIWDEHGNYLEEDLTTEQVQDLLNNKRKPKVSK